MSSSSYRNEKPMYFLHLHIAGQTNCMWYSETDTKFGLHPDVLFAHACDKEDGELPHGRLVVMLSRHAAAVIDGVLHDTYQDDRGGTRCVYGYWIKD